MWEDLRHIARHVEWMADAEAIHFESDQIEGIGTRFQTVTRVGPVRLTDVMAVTEWEPPRMMGIRHTGVVTGTGRFTLDELPGGRTRLTWEEELNFPVWMGGALGGTVGKQILARIWQHNLDRLGARFV